MRRARVLALATVMALVLGCGNDPAPPAPGDPVPRFSTTLLDFGDVQAGSSKDLTFQLTNAGEGVLSGGFQKGSCDPPSVPGEASCWTLEGDVAYQLAHDETKTFTVRFAPYANSTGGAQCGIGSVHCQFESPHGTMHCGANGLP